MERDTSEIYTSPDNAVINIIADRIVTYFFGEEEELNAVLASVGINDIEDLLGKISSFLDTHLKLTDPSGIDVEKIDLRKLVVSFIKETGLRFPEDLAAEDSKRFQHTILKLGRIFIHDMIFPELIDLNPNLAYSVKNVLLRFVREVSIADGLHYQDVLDLLQLDSIIIPFHQPLIINRKPGLKYREIKNEFLELRHFSEASLRKLANILKRDYAAITSVTGFCFLFNSKGEDFEPVDIPAQKLQLIVHLIYRMKMPYNTTYRPLIGMNKGKGFWKFLQQNVTINGNTSSRELRKISSEINDPDFHDIQQIKKQVFDILSQFYESPKI